MLLLLFAVLLFLLFSLFLGKDDWLSRIVKFHELGGEHLIVQHFKLFTLRQPENYILRLEIRVDNVADSVNIIKTH